MHNITVKIIVQQLKRFKNGVAADGMADNGLNYEKNYGVSIVNIMSITNQYKKNNDLAMSLLARPEREAKLAAIFIADPNTLLKEQVDYFANQIVNNEMAEQISMNLISKTTYALEYAMSWCSCRNNEYLQRAGWMTIGRIANRPNIMPDCLRQFSDLIEVAQFSSVHVRNALIYALPKLALKLADCKRLIESWIDDNTKSDDLNKQIVATEVKAFLTL